MSFFQKLAQFFSGLWKDDLEPWLIDFGHTVEHDLVTTLIPFAAESLAEVGNVIGNSSIPADQKAASIGQALTMTINKAVAAGIAVTEHDAATALASVASSVLKGAVAVNQTVVAQVASVPAPPAV